MQEELEIEIDKNVFLPCYHHLINNDADVNFLWGGRDSGKSKFISQRLLLDCLGFNECPYFRCVLIKKTFESIKDAQWQTLKDTVADWGFEAFFTFTTAPLEVNCNYRDGKFIARGCDKPEKLKSIANPSHAWFEEGNQLTAADYITVASTLRTNQGKVKQWFSFNPEWDGDYSECWLYKDYFSNHTGDIYGCTFNGVKEMEIEVDGVKEVVKITYTSTHTTYRDNRYVKPERKAFLELLRHTNPYFANMYTDGRWGNKSNDSPFCFAFDRKKHVKGGKDAPVPTRKELLYLSFDFNRNPMSCTAFQHYGGKLRVLKTIKLANSDIYKLCSYIQSIYIGYTFMITGDATGQNSSGMVRDNTNYYMIIMKELGLASSQMKIPSINPKMEDNQFLVNAVLANYPVEMHEIECKALIFDCENVKMLASGVIDKTDRKDPTKQADALDTFRYFLNTFFWDFVKRLGG